MRECHKNINTKNSFRHYKEIHLKTLEFCPYCFLGIKRLTPHLNNNCKIFKKQKNIENNNKLFKNQAQPENNININKNNEIIINNTIKDINNIFSTSSIDKENAIELEFNFNQKLFDKLFEIYKSDTIQKKPNFYLLKSHSLGKGSFGDINFGLNKDTKEYVAIKIYKDDDLECFNNEVRNLKKIIKI